MSSNSERQWRKLDIAGADLVTFDRPARRLIVTRGHNSVIGTPEELDALGVICRAAAAQITGEHETNPVKWGRSLMFSGVKSLISLLSKLNLG